MQTYYDQLLDFIKNNQDNWQELLSEAPYALKIKQCPFTNEDGLLKWPELYMLSYNQLESDFHNPIVKACRGCVISLHKVDGPKMVCVPFYKFGNYGEGYTDKVDWKTAKVLEKVDGSLLKLFNYKDEWIWITNNGWDINNEIPVALASSFSEPETDGLNTFGALKDYAIKVALEAKGCDLNWEEDILPGLNTKYTYMMELCSPKNRIICDYAKTQLFFLGVRDRDTYKEFDKHQIPCYVLSSIFRQPKQFNLKNIDEVLDLCDSYKDPFNEGVVVCDANFNRFKIKCKHYLALKGLKGEIGFTDQKVFAAIKAEAIDDAIAAFPEIIPQAERIKTTYIQYLKKIKTLCEIGKKEFAKAKYEYICSEDGCNDETYEVTEKEQRKKYANWVFAEHKEYASFLFECIKENSGKLDIMLDKVEYSEIEKDIN